MDEQAKAYFLDIEDHYQRVVGRPLILSPKDVEAVRGWWEQGVPLKAALRGISSYIERIQKDPRHRSRRLAIRYAANDVLDAAEGLRSSRAGDRRGDGLEDGPRVLEVFATLRERLGSPGTPLEGVETELAELRSEVHDLRVSFEEEQLDIDAVEEALQGLDRRLLDLARHALGEEGRAPIRREAEARLSDARARMEEEAWSKTVSLLEEKLLREHCALPRLSLFGY